jgi:hypothetical protein
MLLLDVPSGLYSFVNVNKDSHPHKNVSTRKELFGTGDITTEASQVPILH